MYCKRHNTSAACNTLSSSSAVSGDCTRCLSASRQDLSRSSLSEMSWTDCWYSSCRRSVSLNSSLCLSNCNIHSAIHFSQAQDGNPEQCRKLQLNQMSQQYGATKIYYRSIIFLSFNKERANLCMSGEKPAHSLTVSICLRLVCLILLF